MTMSTITRGAAAAIDDLIDHCAKIEKGHEVLILSQIDGLHGGDNLVDETAVGWIHNAIKRRGANVSILWIDEPSRPHGWRIPPVVKAAIPAADIFINNTFDLVFEEMVELKKFLWDNKLIMVRNMATTAPLLCTAWAQTPYELVSEIRYQAAVPFEAGLPWKVTDDNGTQLQGIIEPPYNPNHPWFKHYTIRRDEAGSYRPWPEWVVPPIYLSKTEGTLVFDTMLSWWSRYIGISPYFRKPVRLTIEKGHIEKIEGGDEADAIKRFLAGMVDHVGEGVYDFRCLHFGVHPQAMVGAHQCPNILYRRLIEHAHSCNIHFHIGAPPATEKYPYWVHCTGDIRKATFRVGTTTIHDRGYLKALEHPRVLEIAAKYPGRPGVEPLPWNY
jgi:hypothetical protein